MRDSINSIFFKLIRISLNESTENLPEVTSDQWYRLYTLSRQHAIVGILYNAIERLPSNNRPPRELLLKWYVATEKIKQRNNHINKTAVKLETLFYANNFPCCILKGPGIAQLYPNPELRSTGDIDVWSSKGKHIVSFVRNYTKLSHEVYHHIDGLNIDGVEIEVHFTPSYMADPFVNRKLQRWFVDESVQQFESLVFLGKDGTIHHPTLAFNRVFILHHIYRHFFYEGVGFRQMMDFYYVLKHGFTKEEREETIGVYKQINLLRFARAVVYVLSEIFGLKEEYHIVPPCEKYGKVLLAEIMLGGNFGQVRCLGRMQESKIRRGWRIIRRNWRFFRFAPSEIFWMPYFKFMNNLVYVRTRHY